MIRRDEAGIAAPLAAMVQALRHRGPDDQGVLIQRAGNAAIGLGHQRLSIIDLSPAGHQPMIHRASGAAIVYNGEIYNFKILRRELEKDGAQFRSDSDTEVILHGVVMHGPEFIDRLQGMYAIALFQPRDQSVLLARDPLGIKPLYVAQTKVAFIFASEVRAILASGLVERKLDKQAMAGLLAYGAVPEPCTIVAGIREFPAGCWQRLAMDLLERATPPQPPRRYWDIPSPRHDNSPESETVTSIQHALDAAVRDHLISDVPIGVFLSSGLDSTIMAGLAARHMDQLRTFTVGFAEHVDLSERELARETAAQLGVLHTEISVSGPDALHLAAKWLDDLDQPSMDGLNVYVISMVVREAGITVAISGQGGDELFGGYPSFSDVPRMRRWMKRAAWVPGAVRQMAASVAGVGKSRIVRDKMRDLAACNGDLLSLYLQRRRVLSNRQLAALGVHADQLGLTNDFLPHEAADLVRIDERDLTWSISHLESRIYMGNMLLRDGDADSMAHSLEIRVPFLDRRVIDLVFALPGAVRLPPGRPKKHLLRQAFGDLLRPALTQQGKRGFELPIKRWMLGPLRDLTERSLAALKSSGAVNPGGVDEIWNSFLREPETPMWSRVWLLSALGAYLQRHKLSA